MFWQKNVTKSSALILPRTALLHGRDGLWQVYIIEKERAPLTDVSVGLTNDFEAELTAGIEVGGRVNTICSWGIFFSDYH